MSTDVECAKGRKSSSEAPLANPFVDVAERAALGPASLEMALPLVTACGITPGARVLEVGGGSGQVATILAQHWSATVFVLEPWHGGEHIQERAARDGVWDRVVALKARAEDLPFADGTFDAVISINSFEMIGESRPEALAQMIRVTQMGGRVGIAEPMCLAETMPPDLAALDEEGSRSFRYCFRTLDWNRELFQRHGLAIVEGYHFPQARQWWLDYHAEGNIPVAERELILRDQGRWLSLGLLVGEKQAGRQP